MAILQPIPAHTAELLRAMPAPGSTHQWLPRAAGGLRHLLTHEQCFRFLRRCCDEWVEHRSVPDREIRAAVAFAYAEGSANRTHALRPSLDWPPPSPALIEKVLEQIRPCFEVDTDSGLSAADVLPRLFRPGEMVCTGQVTEQAMVRPVEQVLVDAHWLQFIVPNPMRGREALNHQGKPSPRCQNNIGVRRHLVAEFDDVSLAKAQQARLITWLADSVPLVLVVDSGGKSLHGWFRVDHLSRRDQVRFFGVACLVGADPTRWDVCGWLRMPGGLRLADGIPSIHQRILYLNPEVSRG